MSVSSNEIEATFWTQVAQCQHHIPCTKCCWPWNGRKDSSGYGVLYICGPEWGNMRAPVLALEFAHGAMLLPFLFRPGRLLATHRCDNPPCCNPAHLRWGTHGDNIRDAIRKGRWRAGGKRGKRMECLAIAPDTSLSAS